MFLNIKSRSTSLQTNQTPVSSTPPQRSSTISEHREEAEDRFDESPALSGPRMSALDPELRKRISVTSRNSKSSSTSRLSGMTGRTRRSSSVSKIENFQLSLGPRKFKAQVGNSDVGDNVILMFGHHCLEIVTYVNCHQHRCY